MANTLGSSFHVQGKASPTPLPLLHLAVEAAWRTWRSRRELLWILLIPLVSFVTLNLWLLSRDTPRIMGIALVLAEVVVLAFAAASCHRLFLLGPRAVPKLGVNGRQMREWIFAGLFVVVYVLMIVLLALFMVLGSVPYERFVGGDLDAAAQQTLRTLAWLPVIYVTSRLLLVLPARSIDAPIAFRTAWRMSDGNGWRLAVLLGGVPWVLHLTEYSIADLFASDTDYTIVRSILYMLVLPFEVGLLSLSYRYLSRAQEPSAPGAQESS